MKLKSFQVTNFRSVEDSGECQLEQVLCLVGKNEAGKTALLTALAGLNPHPSSPVQFDKERDYPRRYLTEYADRHSEGDAVVIRTHWQPEAKEIAAIEAELGTGALIGGVTALRRYGSKVPEVEVTLDYPKIVTFLLQEVPAEERQVLDGVSTTQALREALEKVSPRTEEQEKVFVKLQGFPNKNGRGFAEDVVRKALPQFLYFSHYDRMDGQIRLDTYAQRFGEGSVKAGERVFVDFLEYAGTSVPEILQSKTFEGLNAKCEAASIRITDQLQEYWKQNPHLEIEVRVTKAEPGDVAPFNDGTVARARVKNNVHKVTVPFSERSAGFIWFFSFLVKFAQVRKTGASLVLLLDEPGLTLHGKAQADLLRYFDEKLAPHHQVIFTTHSPFMVPPDNLPAVRIVEDRVQISAGRFVSEGTKVRDDALALDRDTLFPLQGALGYEITQTLFVGKHTLLVEGPGDILFLQILSSALEKRKRTKLDPRWTICPAGGIDKIQPFVGLFLGAKLEIAALSDYAKRDAKKFDSLRRNQILSDKRLLNFAQILGRDEADIEDIFEPSLFVKIVNAAFSLPADQELTVAKLDAEARGETRLLKKVENCFRLLPASAPEYNHYKPPEWLFFNPTTLDGKSAEVLATLDRAEAVVRAVNDALAP